MSIRRQFYPSYDLVVFTHENAATRADVLDLIDTLEADARYDGGLSEIHDMTRVDGHGISHHEQRELWKLMLGVIARLPHRRINADKRNAFVTPGGAITQEVAIFLEVMDARDCTQTSIYADLDSAVRGLGLPDLDADPAHPKASGG